MDKKARGGEHGRPGGPGSLEGPGTDSLSLAASFILPTGLCRIQLHRRHAVGTLRDPRL